MKPRLIQTLSVVLVLFSFKISSGQPNILKPGFTITRIETVQNGAIRLGRDPVSDELFYIRTNGNFYKVIRPTTGPAYDTLIYTSAVHGVIYVQGMAFHDSTLYISGNIDKDTSYTKGIIMRGRLQPNGTRSWDTLMITTFYETADYFDHLFSGLAVSPGGDSIFICSGARGDHGEVQTRYGQFPNLRNVPMTTNIFTLPTNNPSAIVLQNDSAWLASSGYLYARGVRNTFDMAFDADGHLFGVENSGDRDHNEEMNWLQRGHHYGFPWRMGDTENPQQYPWFDPAADSLISHFCRAWKFGFWNNDPGFPPPPASVTFDSPIQNFGPDCDKFRDSLGGVHDASDMGISMGTFTGHRSPLGLVFDTQHILGPLYSGDAFMLSYTRGYLDTCGCRTTPDTAVGPYVDLSQDLVHLDLTFDSVVNNFRLNATKVIDNFNHPVDAEIDSNKIYVIETGGAGTSGLYEITLPVAQYPCLPLLNIPLTCTPDSSVIIIPSFGMLPDNVSWYDWSGNLIRTDSGLTAPDTMLALPAGAYYAILQDGGACPVDTIGFAVPDSFVVVVDSVHNATCIGCCDGEIFVHYLGGTPPYLQSMPLTNLCVGSYMVCAIDANGCDYCDAADVLEEPSSIEGISSKSVEVFPNPSSTRMTVKISGDLKKNISINLVNAEGKTIDRQISDFGRSVNEFIFDTSKLPSGFYWLSIEIDGNRIYRKAVILNER